MKKIIDSLTEEISQKYDLSSMTEDYLEWKQKLKIIKKQEKRIILSRNSGYNFKEKSPLEYRQQYIEDVVNSLDASLQEAQKITKRMLINWDYDPSNNLQAYWDDNCHPIYATRYPEDRNLRFNRIVRGLIAKRKIHGFVDDIKNQEYLASARKISDAHRLRYDDFIMAQVIKYYPRCYIRHLKSKHSPKIAKRWIAQGRYKPMLFKI